MVGATHAFQRKLDKQVVAPEECQEHRAVARIHAAAGQILAQSQRQQRPRKQRAATPTRGSPVVAWILAHDLWVLVAVAVLARGIVAYLVPSLTYDGTYYLRKASDLLRGHYDFAGFPPGYPLLVALFLPLVKDAVLVGATINFLAGTASVVLVQRLGLRYLTRGLAFVAALVVAVHPHFARNHIEIWSEPVYTLALLAAMLLYHQRRLVWSGLLLAYAFLCRPEALLVYGGLLAVEVLRSRRVPFGFLLGLVPVLAFSVLASHAVGHLVISPKSAQFDTGGFLEQVKTLFQTLHYVFPLVLIPFAAWHAIRSRNVLGIPALYLLLLPFFAIHIQPRIHLPAVTFLILLSLAWWSGRNRGERWLAGIAAVVLLAIGLTPELRSYGQPQVVIPYARVIGEELKQHLHFEDKVAARFPFVPYYAGAGFVRWPLALYPELIDQIRAEGATYALVMEDEVHYVPAIEPLFRDAALVRGDGRLWQVARIDGAFYRTALFRVTPPPISLEQTQTVGHDTRRAVWLQDGLVVLGTDRKIDLSRTSVKSDVLRQAADEWSCFDIASNDSVLIFVVGTTQPGSERRVARWSASEAAVVTFDATAPDRPVRAVPVSGGRVLYITDDGALRGLDPWRAEPYGIRVRGYELPEWQPRGLASRRNHDGEYDVALTFERRVPAQARESQLVVLRWPAPGSDATVLQPRWYAALPLADDAVAWVPERDRLVASLAWPRQDGNGKVVQVDTALCLVDSIAIPRRLTFEFDAPKQPTLRRRDGRTLDVAFIEGDGVLRATQVVPNALNMPTVELFN